MSGALHWLETGLVPEVLDDDGDLLIIQSRIPGGWVEPGDSIDPEVVGETLGSATARLLAVPLTAEDAAAFESHFYDGQPLRTYIDEIVTASRQIQHHVDCYRSTIFDDSLTFLESQVLYLLDPPHRLYHQDAGNVIFRGSHFSGFFDLEMCRVGTLPMQIGCLWDTITKHRCWDAFARGYASVTGRVLGEEEHEGGRAFAHFMVWRYVSRYGKWRGENLDDAGLRKCTSEAEDYRTQLEQHGSTSWSA